MTSAARIAGFDDIDVVTEILVGAFFADPLWGPWSFPDHQQRREQHRAMWRLFVEGALRYPWVRLTSGGEATAVWIPPNGTELTDEQSTCVEPLLVELLGEEATRPLEAFAMLDEMHPHGRPPHFHLSLLGTDPRWSGRGIGLGLLQENLREIDALRMPAYLEASNRANVALYERYGFRTLRSIQMPSGGPEVVTMWRDAAVS